jgi:hypothetical protein
VKLLVQVEIYNISQKEIKMKSMEPVCELCGRPLIFFRLTGENEGFLMARCGVCEPSRFGFQENAINLYGFDGDHAKLITDPP